MGTVHVGFIVKLVMGVIDIPYANAPRDPDTKAKSGTQTTGDVAGWLEEKYGLMQHFYDAHQTDIAADFENALAGALETVLMGGPAPRDVFAGATSKVEERFKTFLSSKEAERVGMAGVPTQAALNGVNHRLKHPYRKSNPRRPSFIDTGMFQASMKAWTEE